MGLKFDIAIVVMIVLTSLITMSVDLHDQNKKNKTISKEMIFYETTFTEVTSKGFVDRMITKKGWREGGKLVLTSLDYRNDTVKRLMADKGMTIGDMFYLDGNVSLYRYDGFRYFTEHAVYDKKSGIFEATSPFKAYMNGNMLEGESMRYNTYTKILYAMIVHGEIELKKEKSDKTNEVE